MAYTKSALVVTAIWVLSFTASAGTLGVGTSNDGKIIDPPATAQVMDPSEGVYGYPPEAPIQKRESLGTSRPNGIIDPPPMARTQNDPNRIIDPPATAQVQAPTDGVYGYPPDAPIQKREQATTNGTQNPNPETQTEGRPVPPTKGVISVKNQITDQDPPTQPVGAGDQGWEGKLGNPKSESVATQNTSPHPYEREFDGVLFNTSTVLLAINTLSQISPDIQLEEKTLTAAFLGTLAVATVTLLSRKPSAAMARAVAPPVVIDTENDTYTVPRAPAGFKIEDASELAIYLASLETEEEKLNFFYSENVDPELREYMIKAGVSIFDATYEQYRKNCPETSMCT